MERLYICIFIAIFLAMLTVPLISVNYSNSSNEKISLSQEKDKQIKDENVKIFISDEKKVKKISLEEYLVGVAMSEMDESYKDEALKAQIVAAHTLLEFRKQENKDKKYDITDDYSIDQGYLSYEKRVEKYGKSTDELENNVKKLVKDVKNELIYYNGEPILAVYHDTSGGKTENASDIWGEDYPYLKSVDSISDLLNPKYLSTVTYTKQEFSSLLKTIDGTLTKDEKAYIGAKETTDSGTVKSIKIGKKSFSGEQIRTAFSLRSANFDLIFEEDKFIFTVRGFGHGVGMSQYGANFLAGEGVDYKEILKSYYTDVEIK